MISLRHVNEMRPDEVRALIRKGEITGPTAGMAGGFTQANLVILKKELAFEFLLFCQRNQKPCPILDVTDPGSPVASIRRRTPISAPIFQNTAYTSVANWRMK